METVNKSAKIIKLRGVFMGTYVSNDKNLKNGTVCKECLNDDDKFIHIWSH